ncbi:MAG TPA: PAS domain S-box protein, partial [Kiritimatiellia bacterium]
MFDRVKTSFIILLGIAVLLFIIHSLASLAILRTAKQHELSLTRESLLRATGELDDRIERLDAVTREWAAREDMGSFASAPSDAFLQTKFNVQGFERMEITFVLVAASDGRVIGGMYFNPELRMLGELPAELKATLPPDSPLLQPLREEEITHVSGLHTLANGMTLIAAHAIAPSDIDMPSDAVLIMGRMLDPALVADLVQVTRIAMTFSSLDDPAVPERSDFESKTDPESSIAIRTLADDVTGHMLVRDISSHPVQVLSVKIPRDFYKESRRVLRHLMGFLVSFALLAGVAILLLLQRASAQETKLRDSEDLFRTFFESSPSGTAIINLDGHFLRVNKSLEGLLGYYTSELRDRTWPDTVYADDVDLVTGLVQDLRSGDVANITSVNRFSRRDGTMVWCQVSAAAVPSPEGPPAYIVATFEDITDIKDAEMREQTMAQLLKGAVSAADELIGCPDSDTLYRRAVELARQRIGVERCTIFIKDDAGIRGTYGTNLKGETTDERSYRPLMNDRWAERLRPMKPGDPKWRIANEALQEWNGNLPIELKEGWIAVTPIQSPLGPIGVLCNDTGISRRPVNPSIQEVLAVYASILGNIIERKRAEYSLRRMGMAVQQTAESIIITDTQGVIEYVNPAFIQITGYSPDEVIGASTRVLKSGRHDKAFYERLWSALAKGEVWSGQFTNKRKDGSLYDAFQTISPIRDATGRIINYVSVSRDITREMELEAQFIQAQKMEGIGRLAGGIAHDFNNLLTAILGNSKLIREEVGKDNPIQAELDEIIQAGERAAKLTKQLLAFARKQIVQLRPLQVNNVVAEMSKFLRRTLGEHIKVELQLGNALGFVQADSGLIEQLLMNLSVNARDAMPKGGTLTIHTANVDRDRPPAQSRGPFKPGPYVMIAVADTGSGMTDEVAQHVFEPFYTTKEVGKGTGLGLATVYGIVEQCGGHIEFDTKLGTGTEFRVYLPRAAAGDAAAPEPAAVPRARENETILLVEDEDPVRNLTVRILESLGYKVIAARHGREGLEIFQLMGDNIDLVVTDVVMPQMGGPDLVAQLRRFSNFRAAIYTSGFTAGTLLDHGLMDQEWILLLKPYTREELAHRVRETLDKYPRAKG